jgi:UDP-N-acetyl-D-mannosaminuronate dehydrogenase
MNLLKTPPGKIAAQISSGKIPICIVGMGHIGLPLALLLVDRGARVIGCDKNEAFLAELRAGRSPIVEQSKNLFPSSKVLEPTCPACGVHILRAARETFCPSCMRRVEVSSSSVRLTNRMNTAGTKSGALHEMEELLTKALASGNLELTSDTPGAVRRSGIIVITVGTPIDSEKRPDTRAPVSASADIGSGLRKGSVVIVRSTVSPGTTEDIVEKILKDESGLAPGKDFGLAHVTETTIEGLALFELRTLSKMIGGIDPGSSRAAAGLFTVFGAPIHIFEGPRITETVKLFLNIYRDVNIALANELALACEAVGVDVMKAIAATRADPKTNILTPGPGVGGYCLPPWVKVQTENGLREISGIGPGDQVLAHDGQYHSVTKVLRRNYEGPLLRIVGRGFNAFPIECTPEHPILVRKRIPHGKRFYDWKGKKKLSSRAGFSDQNFLGADSIEWGDVLCLPTLKPLALQIPSVSFSYDYHRRGIWQEIATTTDMMYLFGLYVAEGTIWENEISFALHKKEQFIVDELDSIATRAFGNGVRIHGRVGNGMTARMQCEPLAEYLGATFGHRSWEKSVPMTWVTSLPEDHLTSLLKGIWLGDGSNSQGVFRYGTVSESLWNFLQLALLRLGVRFSVSEMPRHQGRDGRWHKHSYYIKSSDITKMDKIVHPSQRLTRTRQEYRTMWFEGDFLEFPVRSVSARPFTGEVWNLEVENANSYVLQGGVVHNCLTKDGFYLTKPAEERGFVPNIITAAREVNDSMPSHVRQLVLDALREAGKDASGCRVAALGLAFKGNTADTRDSPSLLVIEKLTSDGAEIVVHDPLVKADDTRSAGLKLRRAKTLRDAVKGADAVVILTDHLEYRGLTGAGLRRLEPGLKVVVDTRHILDPQEARSAGLVYRGVGQMNPSRG